MTEQEKFMPHKPAKPKVTTEELLHTIFGDATDEPKLSPEEQETVTGLEDEAKGFLKIQVESAINSLNPRERLVMELRHGLEDGRSRTLEEVGREIGRSKSTAWRIQHSALRKLRAPISVAGSRDYLE